MVHAGYELNPSSLMPHPQFSIRTLLWLTLVVAAFLGGMKLGAWREANQDPFMDGPIER